MKYKTLTTAIISAILAFAAVIVTKAKLTFFKSNYIITTNQSNQLVCAIADYGFVNAGTGCTCLTNTFGITHAQVYGRRANGAFFTTLR